MNISAIYVYPVKSLKGVSLESAQLTAAGFEHDRQWMVVHPDGRFLTQRECPQMALVETAIDNGKLVLDTFGMESHTVEPVSDHSRRISTAVWGDPVSAMVQAPDTNEWLSQAIGLDCRLVSFPVDQFRQCDPEISRKGDHVKFADAFPVLVISQASLDFLNSKLSVPVGMNRFRPNLVITGCEAHDEDDWESVRVNGLRLRNGTPCGRCSVPTVDPDAGVLAGPEPIHTLSSYRQRDGEIHFGMTFIPDTEGILSVGDPVSL
ncbi:MAG: MOSC domain-containing protein [Gammaproteobacteria bacterium]|nr:MOSC domain-containing protein [Gammaproteobacteria bacterium]